MANAQTYSIECGEYIGEDVREIKVVTESRIQNAPTVDAVEVVRCKECIHVHDNDCPLAGGARSDEVFCSYGERKEGAVMRIVEALECFESDCETCQFKGRDCKSCRTKVAISALRREIKN